MKYIVIELQKNSEGNVANIVTSFDSLAEAESKYHAILSVAAISKIPVHSAIIVSEEGFPVEHKCYKHNT